MTVLSKEQRAACRRWVALTGASASAVGGWLLWTTRSGVDMPGQQWWPLVLIPGVALLVGAVWSWWSQVTGSAGVVSRMTTRSLNREGQATRGMVRRRAGKRAVRKQLRVVRPDLAHLSWWQQHRLPVTEVGSYVARVGRQWLMCTQEETTVKMAGPRMGKSGSVAYRMIDAPGAVIATSTRADLYQNTHRIREQVGPVYVYDPAETARDLATTIAWDPLMGCQDGPTAYARAGDLMQGTTGAGAGGRGGDSKRDYWLGLGRDALGALMHAAALGGYTMRDVQRWVADADDQAVQNLVLRLLDAGADPAYRTQALQFFSNNHETRSSIQTTIMPALSWLSHPAACATTTGPPFDVARLLAEKATVFLFATKEHQHVVPLLTSLAAHIAREIRKLAGGERLKTPVLFALDEAAVICPVPLDSWTADFGGFNIQLVIAVQGASQLRQTYGEDGAATIMTNAGVLMQYGGSKYGPDLKAVSELLGERPETQVTTDGDGKVISKTTHRVPVLGQAQLSQLERYRCVVLRSGMPPVLARAPMVWEHPAVKALARRDKLAHAQNRLRSVWHQISARAVQLEATRSEKRLRRHHTSTPDPDVRPLPASHDLMEPVATTGYGLGDQDHQDTNTPDHTI